MQPIPYIQIIEQPSKSFRFRYECEGRSAGSIHGISSTKKNVKFPAIAIIGGKGKARIVVSCITKEKPYQYHKHKIVGKGEGFKDGKFTKTIDGDTMSCIFSNLGIQCVSVKNNQAKQSPTTRKTRKAPYDTCTPSIDLSAVRLGFQVFLLQNDGKTEYELSPVVSDPIFNRQANTDLTITNISHGFGSSAGGEEIILLCEKVCKDNIAVRFYEEINGQCVWEAYGDFQPADVHKQFAICFKTPAYNRIKNLEYTVPVKCFIQLKQLSGGQTSDPVTFWFLPISEELGFKIKIPKLQHRETEPLLKSANNLSFYSVPHVNTSNETMLDIYVGNELTVNTFDVKT